MLALRGAELVCVPNASLADVSDLFVPTMRASAAANLVYVVASNRAGVEVALPQAPEARAAGRGPGDHPLQRPILQFAFSGHPDATNLAAISQRASFEEARTRGTEAIDLRATSRTAPFH